MKSAPAPQQPAPPPPAAEAAPPPPPVNQPLKDALDTRAAADAKHIATLELRREHEAVQAFYAARNYALAWSADGKLVAAAAPAIARLQHAADDALSVKGVPATVDATDPTTQVATDIALSDAVVAYARQASGSRVNPSAISALIGDKPNLADGAKALDAVIAAGADAGTVLEAYNPSQPGYVALRTKLAELRARPAATAAISSGANSRTDSRGPLVHARFSPADAAPRRLEDEIIANMERWRWMPREIGADRVEVNVPDFEVRVFRDGQEISKHKVIVGKDDTPTPIFSNTMKFLIVNPYWNVPQSIVRKEMLPKLAADPNYLHRLGYETVTRHGELIVRQPPGERNALGQIKFMFPNDYAVYLHDTPTRRLFSAGKRAFSHGCVRVDDPFGFGAAVMGAANGWNEARIQKLIGGKERYVYLPKPLPIYIEYFTAYVDQGGRLQLRDDVYGYSHKVQAALGLAG